jgi:alpha,alpha-trehalase
MLIFLLLGCVGFSDALGQKAEPERTAKILQYIHQSWDALTRSMADCATLADPKATGEPVLYLPAGFEQPAEVGKVGSKCGVEIRRLPRVIHRIGEKSTQNLTPGLLYLPNKYVVPGGRFNEMYGWDSYFIILGLLRDGRKDLARGIVENFFFEIEHYGGVLNANRAYYLTRSQPPFLSSMVLAVHDNDGSQGGSDRAWLSKAYEFVARDYGLWTSGAHLAGNTGLSRYFDFGEGPVPEMADTPGYYGDALRYFEDHSEESPDAIVHAKSGDALSADFYKGDRSMRESGFDTTFRLGAYGARTHHFAVVDLNCLLYKTEKDLAQMATILGRATESAHWNALAELRRERVNRWLWNAREGMYFDFDFVAHKQSNYKFASTFYPLWAGLASKEQAAAIAKHLGDFERAGGILTSTRVTGAQWDAPFGWAPLQLIAAEGLRRYGFEAHADRVSEKFDSMVEENFERDATIREKYDVVKRSTDTHVQAGYSENVVGFGWTNGVFVELLHEIEAHKLSSSPGKRKLSPHVNALSSQARPRPGLQP